MRRRYSDEERAAALAALQANGGNIDRTAQQVGVPRKTLKYWIENPDNVPAEVRQRKKVELSRKLDRIAHKLANAIPGKIERASMKDCATAMGIAIDKQRLIAGLPTQRTALELPDLEQLRTMPFDELVRLHRQTLALSSAQGGD